MKFTKLFTKTNKQAKEYDSVNATYLLKGGFIHQTMSGVYSYLPLGLRVLNKIEKIVREEMDKIAQEIYMPSLAPKEIWQTTKRLDSIDVLMKTTAANKVSLKKSSAEYILNPTHEDIVTPIAQSYNLSYKDLPKTVYQIQTKFRNEARPKGGLLRGREFRMKDLYSFHPSMKTFEQFYDVAKNSYIKVFERLGIGDITHVTLASGGDFTENFSHEFQTECENGEDLIFRVPSTGVCFNKEVTPSKVGSELDFSDVSEEKLEKVHTPGIVGVDKLCEFMNVDVKETTKTLIYQADEKVIVAALRGDYEVNEIKLKKILGCKDLELASEETVKEVTGAEVGYAGILNMPRGVEVYMDDSIENLKNFETGANETEYHYKNVNFERDVAKPEHFYDFKEAQEGDFYPETNEKYEVFKASEAGNIFPLETKFTDAFNYTYTDENGTEQKIYMGSYGIGTTRLMGIIVEACHDQNGIIWPENIAPYKVHLIGLNLDDENIAKECDAIYEDLTEKGIEVIYDDREKAKAGEKFADADLLGCPIRLVYSRKTDGKLEFKRRTETEAKILSLDETLEQINQ